jgi:hypothetical protein
MRSATLISNVDQRPTAVVKATAHMKLSVRAIRSRETIVSRKRNALLKLVSTVSAEMKPYLFQMT